MKVKKVYIKRAEFFKTKVKKKHNKFQKFIAKLFGLHISDTHLYSIRIHYKGQTRLKKEMILINKDGVIFTVLDERNWMAMIVTVYPQQSKPFIYGWFEIVEKIDN